MAESRRLKLQKLLEETTGLDEHHVKFQPPSNFQMSYPCLRYRLENSRDISADNTNYIHHRRYALTLIHSDPDNDIVEKLASLPLCSFDRSYTANNLNHYVFSIFY